MTTDQKLEKQSGSWAGRYGRDGGGKFELAVADQSRGKGGGDGSNGDKCGELTPLQAKIPDIQDIHAWQKFQIAMKTWK